MALTTEQEELFDDSAFVVNAYVFILAPTLVFEAPLVQANARAKAYVSLEYGTPTVGAIADVKKEMTLEIDIAGRADGGRQRVRGKEGDSNLILIGRTAPGRGDGRLTVNQGGTIRVYNEYRPFIKAPYISKDGLTQYKDETIYPGDNEAQPPVASAGNDRLIITNSASASVILDALGEVPSYAPRGAGTTLASFSWDVDDGTITSGVDTDDTITVSFPRGARYIRLTVTDTNGVSHTTSRLIVVARKEDCIPAQIDTYSVVPEGTSMSLKIDASKLPENIPTGAKVLVAEQENYSNTTIIGYAERFSGWLGTETAALENARNRYSIVDIELYGIGEFLRNNYLFPQSINIADGTGGWYEMANANVDRLMHHLIHWHTNILSVTGFKRSGEGATYPFSELTTSGGSFWSDLSKLANAFAHQITCNSLGQIKVLPHPHIVPTADQASTYALPTQRPTGIVTTFTENRFTKFRLSARKKPTTYWLQATALLASEAISNVVSAIAPSNAPGGGTSGEDINDWLVTSQDELNVWAGNHFASAFDSHVDNLAIDVFNPSFIVDPSELQYVAVNLPDWLQDRYNLPNGSTNRWTVESVTFSYNDTGKKASYVLRKEVVASEPARKTSQGDDDEIIQVWPGFDGSISPTTGAILQEFEGSPMSLTQAQLEESLRKSWLKWYVGEGSIDDVGGVTGGDGDGDTDGDTGSGVGAGSHAEQAERNGGMYEIARRLADFWSQAQTVYTAISAELDAQARFEQFVKVAIIESSDAAVTAWWTYISGEPDPVLPSLTLSQRESITSYMYCIIIVDDMG
jgi:hypothetical protein